LRGGAAPSSRAPLIQSRFAGRIAVAVWAVLLGVASPGPASAQERRAPDPTVISAPFVRNDKVQEVVDRQGRGSQQGQASSAVMLLGDRARFKSWAFDYHTGLAKEMNILQAPRDGMVRGTVVVNASGHTGQAEQFARSNTYTVRIQLPDGRVLVRSGIPRNVTHDPTKRANTPEYATSIDVEFPYERGVTDLTACPDGSGCEGGYVEGRLYHVHSADQPWDANAQLKASKEHRAPHPYVEQE
jgi:hypothetical protein